MPKQPPKPRWSIERRLEFIEFRLYWEGRVNRSDLIDHFGISMPQASSDLTHYQEVAEGNIVYDKTAKAYVASSKFKPVLFNPSADRYLAELRLLDASLSSESESWLGKPPVHSIVPPLRRRLEPRTLRSVLDAIRTGSSVEVNYQSFSGPDPRWRRLTPHAIAFDGSRWHVRAWCHSRLEFRDFVIGRMLGVRGAKPDELDAAKDLGWSTHVTLRLGPHPKLTDGARRVTELDYGMEDGQIELPLRACLVPYFVRRERLNRSPAHAPPEDLQIILLNHAEVDAAIRKVGVTLSITENDGLVPLG